MQRLFVAVCIGSGGGRLSYARWEDGQWCVNKALCYHGSVKMNDLICEAEPESCHGQGAQATIIRLTSSCCEFRSPLNCWRPRIQTDPNSETDDFIVQVSNGYQFVSFWYNILISGCNKKMMHYARSSVCPHLDSVRRTLVAARWLCQNTWLAITSRKVAFENAPYGLRSTSGGAKSTPENRHDLRFYTASADLPGRPAEKFAY